MESNMVWQITVHADDKLEGAPWSADHYRGSTIVEAIEKAIKDAKSNGLKGIQVSKAEFICSFES